MGPQSDFNFAPREQDIGVMPLLLRDRSDAIYKIQGLLEIGKSKCARNVVFVYDFPVRPLGKLSVQVIEFFSLKWRRSTPARHASFACKF